MTINYCCWTSGNDTTGDGSAGNPYKTITKASTGLSGGDEVRVSKSPAHTALAGTLSFTDGSTSVGTSTDLTAVLAAGALIGKDADDGMWYEVASLNSTTITLRYKYSGTTNASATAYKMGFHDYGSPAGTTTALQTVSAAGSSNSSLLKISGGWDLSSQTKTAKSFFCVTHSTNTYGYGLTATNRHHVEISNLIMCRLRRGYSLTGLISYIDCEVYANSTDDAFIVGESQTGKNLKACGCARTAISFNKNSYGENIRADSCLATSLYEPITIETSVIIKNIIVRRNAFVAIELYGGSLIGTLVAEYNDSNAVNIKCTYGGGIAKIGKLTSVTNACAVYVGSGGMTIIGSLVVSGSVTADHGFSSTYNNDSPNPYLVVQRWGDTQGDSRMFFERGSAVRDTAEARSGACIKATPASATYYINISLGKYLVTSDDADLTLSIYAKDDGDFNGDVKFMALMNGQVAVLPTAKTMDTSYGEHTLVVDTDDLVENEWLELVAMVRGTAGNVYFDDFSVS